MALILTGLTLLSKIGGEVIISEERVYLDRPTRQNQGGRCNGT